MKVNILVEGLKVVEGLEGGSGAPSAEEPWIPHLSPESIHYYSTKSTTCQPFSTEKILQKRIKKG